MHIELKAFVSGLIQPTFLNLLLAEMLFETKWTGEQKIVIAIDCGTTLSEIFNHMCRTMLSCFVAGVTYVHLLPQGKICLRDIHNGFLNTFSPMNSHPKTQTSRELARSSKPTR